MTFGFGSGKAGRDFLVLGPAKQGVTCDFLVSGPAKQGVTCDFLVLGPAKQGVTSVTFGFRAGKTHRDFRDFSVSGPAKQGVTSVTFGSRRLNPGEVRFRGGHASIPKVTEVTARFPGPKPKSHGSHARFSRPETQKSRKSRRVFPARNPKATEVTPVFPARNPKVTEVTARFPGPKPKSHESRPVFPAQAPKSHNSRPSRPAPKPKSHASIPTPKVTSHGPFSRPQRPRSHGSTLPVPAGSSLPAHPNPLSPAFSLHSERLARNEDVEEGHNERLATREGPGGPGEGWGRRAL